MLKLRAYGRLWTFADVGGRRPGVIGVEEVAGSSPAGPTSKPRHCGLAPHIRLGVSQFDYPWGIAVR